MKNFDFKKLLPHIAAIVIFVVISVAYFYPEIQGKKIFQSDIAHWKGMSKELVDYRNETGEEGLWTNSAFSGMPGYLISVKYPIFLVRTLDAVIPLGFKGGIKYLLLYLIGFYILMQCLRVNPWLSVVAAIAFAFSSYLFVIVEAGHNTKAHALGYVAPVLGGFILLFKEKKYLIGTAVTTLFLSLHLFANHFQITYYLLIALFLIGLGFLIYAIKQKEFKHISIASGLFIFALLIAISSSSPRLFSVFEYSKYSTRSKSELKLDDNNQTSGLDKNYVTQWSYGKAETFSLMVPNIKGAISGPIGNDKNIMKEVSAANRQNIANIDRYWGDEPFVSGAHYAGVIVMFLALLALFFIKGPLKYGALAAIILSIMLAWGRHFMSLTDFFLDNIPYYNKFRAVSTTLVIAELLIPLLAFYGVHLIIKNRERVANHIKQFYIAAGVFVGILVLMYIMPSMFTDFFKEGEYERLLQQLNEAGFPPMQIDQFMMDVETARMSFYNSDVLRGLIYVLLAGGLIWAFIKEKLNSTVLIVGLGLLITVDMWSVNKRYLNEDDFVNAKKIDKPYQQTAADQQILADKDPNFRVFNTTARLDQDSKTSYFHKSLGGYHAAKMKRYQELIDFYLSKGDMNVVNMLNTKYFIVQSNNGGVLAQQNPQAFGNAWFVQDVKLVNNANEEIESLKDVDLRSVAVVDKRFEQEVKDYSSSIATDASIKLTSYKPNELKYDFNSSSDKIVVFSEVYYDKGWNAYVDGKLNPHFRANYVLRAMKVPAGNHTIEFKFEPKTYQYGSIASIISGIIIILLFAGVIYKTYFIPKN